MLKYLDEMNYGLLILFAVLMLLAPFQPQPHLVEKWQMFRAGTLRRAIDIFDVFFHLAPTILLLVKVIRDLTQKGG